MLYGWRKCLYVVLVFVVILLQVMWFDTLKYRNCRGRVSVTIEVYTRERRVSSTSRNSAGHKKNSRLVCNCKEFQGILMAEQWTRGSRDSDTRPESSTSIDTAWVRLSLWLDMQLCLLFLAFEIYDLLCIPVLSTLEWRTPICYLHKDVKVFFGCYLYKCTVTRRVLKSICIPVNFSFQQSNEQIKPFTYRCTES